MASLRNLEFKSETPQLLSENDWQQIHELMHLAFSHADLPRSQEEIDYFIKWHQPESFIASRLDPSEAVEAGQLNPNQNFGKLRVTRAFDNGSLIGYVYSADNTSGESSEERWNKMHYPHLIEKKWAWMREVAVHPDYRRQHVASALGHFALQERHPKQGLAAYIWSGHDTGLKIAQKLEMQEGGAQFHQVFGPETELVEQIRFSSTVEKASTYLLQIPEVAELAKQKGV